MWFLHLCVYNFIMNLKYYENPIEILASFWLTTFKIRMLVSFLLKKCYTNTIRRAWLCSSSFHILKNYIQIQVWLDQATSTSGTGSKRQTWLNWAGKEMKQQEGERPSRKNLLLHSVAASRLIDLLDFRSLVAGVGRAGSSGTAWESAGSWESSWEAAGSATSTAR